MKTFACMNCGYTFDKKDKKVRQYCPYCGKENIEEEKDAEEIVEKVK